MDIFDAYGIVGKRMFPNIFCIWTACQYVLFFYIGIRIRVNEEKQEKQIAESVPWYIWIVTDLLIFTGTIIAERNGGTVWSLLAIGLNLILHMVGAVILPGGGRSAAFFIVRSCRRCDFMVEWYCEGGGAGAAGPLRLSGGSACPGFTVEDGRSFSYRIAL